jgi:hypothetical protein
MSTPGSLPARIVLAAVACAWLGAAAAAEPIDVLMIQSGLHKQIGEFEPSVQAGISQPQAGRKPLDESAMRNLRRAVAIGYAPDRMRATVRQYIVRELPPREIDEVLAWLASDTGKRITAIEEKASEPAEALKMMEGGRKVLEGIDAPRRALIERMLTATRAADFNASVMINTTVAVLRGIELAAPDAPESSEADKLIARLRERRPEIVAAMKGDAAAGFAYLYAPLSDAEVEQYVRFAESDAGTKYHDVTGRAIEIALTEGAQEMGRQLSLAARQQVPRSRT